MANELDKVKITGTTKGYGVNANVDLAIELSLRDLFAAFALAGLSGLYPQGGHSYAETVGPMAYQLADAALAARREEGE